MRARVPTRINPFPNSTEALAVETHCRAAGLPGRIIPVPREVTAGCGLAWKAAPEDRDALLAALDGANLRYEGSYILEL